MADLTPTQNASLALSHLLIGLMKIDGAITVEEESKLDRLLDKLRFGLPGDLQLVRENMDVIQTDADMVRWDPQGHLDASFVFFDDFVGSGTATADHIDAVIDLVDVLSEVDGMSGGETAYLEQMLLEFNRRYRAKS